MTSRRTFGAAITIVAVVAYAAPLPVQAQAQRQAQAPTRAQMPTGRAGARPRAPAEGRTFGLSAGATYSDNIHRSPSDEQEETSIDVGVQLGLNREEGRLQSRVAVDAQYLTYLDDTYEDDLVGGLDASASYWFVPERFAWVIEDNLGQTFIDPRAVETPGNRQNTNYFSTGPDFLFDFGGRTAVSLQGRWSDASYEQTETDNQRLSATLGLLRQLSPRSTVSLNGSAGRVEYDDTTLNSDFDRQSYFVGFDAEGARTTLQLEAGYTALHDFGETTDGPLLNLSASRRVGARSTFTLDVGTNLTDSAESFRRDRGIRGVTVGNEDAVVSGDPYQSDYASLTWDLEGTRNTLQLAADWRREDHEREGAFNRDSIGGSLTLSRRFGARLTGTLDGGWTREDFDESGIDFDEWTAGFGLQWDFARSVGVMLRGEHVDGSGDTLSGGTLPAIGTRDYTENRVTVALTYTPRR